MTRRYININNPEKYLGYRMSCTSLAKASKPAISTSHTTGLYRLNRVWERDKALLDKTVNKLMSDNLSPKDKLLFDARIRKLQTRMARAKDKAKQLAARQGVFLDV